MTENNIPTKQQIRARQRLTDEPFMEARRRLIEGSGLAVGTVGYNFSSSLPLKPVRGFTAPAEEVFAALVANSAQVLTRDSTGETYPALANVVVLRPSRPARADEAPAGWYPVEALVAIRARRLWDARDEDQQVITDAYRAAKETVLRVWPDLPADWTPAAMPLTTLAMLRGWDDQALRDAVSDPLAHCTTVGPDPTLVPAD